MKLSPFAASGLGLGIAAVSILGIAAPANAATPGVTFITASQIVLSGEPDDVGWSNFNVGALTSSINGLSVPFNQELNYGFATPFAADTGTALVDLALGTYFTASDSGSIRAQIFWRDPSNHVGSLKANLPGSGQLSDTAIWSSFDGVDSRFSGTLKDFDDAFAGSAMLYGSTIISVGMYFSAAAPVNLYVFGTRGESFSFLPVPVVTGAPTTIGQVDFGTAGKGFAVSSTGFVPNESVEIYVGVPPNGGGPLTTVVADANGNVSYRWVAATTAETLGDYSFAFVGDDSTAFHTFQFGVVAQATLAATGSDIEIPMIAGSVLLLGGAALAIVAAKRRRTACSA